MTRETFQEVVAYFLTYMDQIGPLNAEVAKSIADLEPEQLANAEILDAIREEEEKRSIHKVKVTAEFASFYRGELFEKIKKFVKDNITKIKLDEIQKLLIKYLTEIRTCAQKIRSLPPIEESDAESSRLYSLVQEIQDILLPRYNSLDQVFSLLFKNSPEWYNCQRYILRSQTYYREEIDDEDAVGISPHLYKIINAITSLLNLDPNYLDDPDNPQEEIPAILVDDVFEPFVDSIASKEKENIDILCESLELRTLLEKRFICPSRKFLDLVSKFGFFVKQQLPNTKIRWVSRLSNETLFLVYLGKISMRRGFLSKELVNWISSNVAFSIFNGTVLAFISDANPFRSTFYDLKTQEKIIPYLMKLICFKDFLRLNRAKIRDSPQYRKEIYNLLGSKIDCQEKLAKVVMKSMLEK